MSEERELTIAQAKVLFATRNVWRWSIVNMPRRQSVAEHSYLVTVLGLCLYDQCMIQHSLIERAGFITYLMQHDAEEALLGDIPATVKEVMERRSPGIINQIKRDMGAEVRQAHAFDKTPLKFLAKIADYAEAFKFVIENHGPDHVAEFLSEHLRTTIEEGMKKHAHSVHWDKLKSTVNEFIDHA